MIEALPLPEGWYQDDEKNNLPVYKSLSGTILLARPDGTYGFRPKGVPMRIECPGETALEIMTRINASLPFAGLKFYVASGLTNRVLARRMILRLQGQGAQVTYDWTQHGSVATDGPERLQEVADAEVRGVMEADFVVIVMPGGRGTHTELGVALGTGSKVFMWLPSDDAQDHEKWLNDLGVVKSTSGYPCVFHYHPLVEIIAGENVGPLMSAIGEWAAEADRSSVWPVELSKHPRVTFLIGPDGQRPFPWYCVKTPSYPGWFVQTNLPLTDVVEYAKKSLARDVGAGVTPDRVGELISGTHMHVIPVFYV